MSAKLANFHDRILKVSTQKSSKQSEGQTPYQTSCPDLAMGKNESELAGELSSLVPPQQIAD